MSGSRERAAEVLAEVEQYAHVRQRQRILAAALDAAEARGRVEMAARVEALAAPGDPDDRMQAYYYGFERTGVGIVDAILTAVAIAGKAYHGTDMWAEEDEWTTPSHEARIQAAADTAANRLRALVADAAPAGQDETGRAGR